MNELTFENFSAPSAVDFASGILKGCSLLTAGIEAKGHGIWTDEITLGGLKRCVDAMVTIKCREEHEGGLKNIVGVLKAPYRIAGQKLLGDLHLFKHHSRREAILEMAQNLPEQIGLSISFSGVPEEINGRKYARVVELYSCDLTSESAANPGGLFSAKPNTMKPSQPIEGFDTNFIFHVARVCLGKGRVPDFESGMSDPEKRQFLKAKFVQWGLSWPGFTPEPRPDPDAALELEMSSIADPVQRMAFVNKNYDAIKIANFRKKHPPLSPLGYRQENAMQQVILEAIKTNRISLTR